MVLFIVLLAFSFIVESSLGNLVYHCSSLSQRDEIQNYNVPLYPVLRWDTQREMVNISVTIIDLAYSRDIFDYCEMINDFPDGVLRLKEGMPPFFSFESPSLDEPFTIYMYLPSTNFI
jgi:hypothetical protein